VMLLRMIKMKISKWCGFNGGFQWKKGQININDIYMKIVEMTSGIVI
jgi:hypothetical protein